MRRSLAAIAPSSAMPVGNNHNSVRLSLVSIVNDVTDAHATRPSGDSVGLPMRLICHSASTSSGGSARERPSAAGRHAEGLKLE